jgi:hypothetical protein
MESHGHPNNPAANYNSISLRTHIHSSFANTIVNFFTSKIKKSLLEIKGICIRRRRLGGGWLKSLPGGQKPKLRLGYVSKTG